MTTTVRDQSSVRRFALTKHLSRPEIILSSALLLVLGLCVSISLLKPQPIAWSGFALGLTPTVGLFAAGMYIRVFKSQPRIAQLAIANSFYLGFMGLCALLIYLRFPIGELTNDQWLMRSDAMLGYSWPAFVETVASYPAFGYALRFVYGSSLTQIFLMIGFLALTGKALQLNQALLAGIFSLLLTTTIWWIIPSVGPTVFHTLPEGLEDTIQLATNSAYAEVLRTLSAQGLTTIEPSNIVGTIAFPSYHTVMALLVVWSLRRTVLFIPALAVNLLMVPAILSHGGHHLTDMAGGICVFACAAWLATRPRLHRRA